MKTFKEEYRELLDWLKEQWDYADALPHKDEGLDGGGERGAFTRVYQREYRQRLRALKEKHGIAD